MKYSIRELFLLITLICVALGWARNYYDYYWFVHEEYPPKYPRLMCIYDNALYGYNLKFIRKLNISNQIEHPHVEIDSGGYVWIADDTSVFKCQKCHGDTWTDADGYASCPQRIRYKNYPRKPLEKL